MPEKIQQSLQCNNTKNPQKGFKMIKKKRKQYV